MPLDRKHLIGKEAMLLLLHNENQLPEELRKLGWKFCKGKVGSMDGQKVVAAVETAAKNQGIVKTGLYRETHALYHAIIEAVSGVTRGSNQIGTLLRTVGLQFSIVRGNPYQNKEEGEWIAVALYGTIGAPVKGLEHEAIGLGINHI
ncbi:hut operon transcriptional regulator HutP [Virgibacillus dakarensis]|uniref:Hut operon positive regulatory protein n=1 Tax=Lentibacillus populi TaxID=1827502 RepID=A0A9W5X7G2_9BACI|nr:MULTISPECIES: hut operon transcriptional regulator HutP [Bacillaceae]MBT2218557.1 hut operon transcriptional regulator HutP [Virgibacillus dakarensis]MTW87170.1 hut operon transcriptional regulator HutP [Virgibacillus dakarensis]GGB59298.1 Hut operon positive regulatory protein [Lentibacillus populi]